MTTPRSPAPSRASIPGDVASRNHYAGIELGGTKAIAVLADGDMIRERLVVPTTDPEATLAPLLDRVSAWHATHRLAGFGIASFGPIRLAPGAPDYGRILTTAKRGWTNAEIHARFAARLDCPIEVDTDVNAAALAEQRWGAGRGMESIVYLTIGTGVGAGFVSGGRTLQGRLHPELGHLMLRRAAGDDFAGVCPFHGDCVEGLIGGPALAARFGRPPASVAEGDRCWDAPAHDLAQLLAVMLHGYAAERIIIGGGVGLGAPSLVRGAVERLPAILAGYYPDLDARALAAIVITPALGGDAGPLGAIALAQRAAGQGR